MTWIGQARAPLIGAALGVFSALVPAIVMWGFTVDDALIPVRYARHLAAGQGYRFNLSGPVSDGVTPLPWVPLLVPLARSGSALDVLFRAKCIGLAAWLMGAASFGVAVVVAPARTWQKAVAFVAIALCLPVAAHAVSGLETGVPTALATAAASVAARRPRIAAVLAGLAAAFRPEMAPWAMVLASALAAAGPHAQTRERTVATGLRVAIAASLAALPFVACATLRLAAFGRAAPLAILAKPGLIDEGLRYAAASFLVTGGPSLALAPAAVRRQPIAAALALAGYVHFAVIAMVGGDWMAYARLAAPVAPSLVLAGILVASNARTFAVRAAIALSLEAYFAFAQGPKGRGVMAERAALIAAARPYLEGARRIAAVDVGWPSAASDHDVVDLAGLTDLEIAALAGGHTSKRVDPAILLGRDPDVLLLYARGDHLAAHLEAWAGASYRGVVETRFARSEVIQRAFTPRAFLPLGTRGEGYVVLARRR